MLNRIYNNVFHFAMHKTADFHSNVSVSWELVTEGYQERPMKCTQFHQVWCYIIGLKYMLSKSLPVFLIHSVINNH